MSNRTLYCVRAPHEGDSPEDATDWWFESYDEADDFANDGWGADYGVTNYSEAGPFSVEAFDVSPERYRKLLITRKVGTGWRTTKAGAKR